MVESEALQPERLLLHASLLTSIAIGLITFLTLLSMWVGERVRKKVQKLSLEHVQQWLSKRGLTPFPNSKRTSLACLLEHRMKHKNQDRVYIRVYVCVCVCTCAHALLICSHNVHASTCYSVVSSIPIHPFVFLHSESTYSAFFTCTYMYLHTYMSAQCYTCT